MKHISLIEAYDKYQEYKKNKKEKLLNKRKEYLKNFLDEMYKRDLLNKVWSNKLSEKETKEYKKKIKQIVKYASDEIIDLFSKRFELSPSKEKPKIVIRKKGDSGYDTLKNKIILSTEYLLPTEHLSDILSFFDSLGEECGHYFHLNIKKSKSSGFYNKTREYIGMLCKLLTVKEFLPEKLEEIIEFYESPANYNKNYDSAVKAAIRDFKEDSINEEMPILLKYFGKAIGADEELKKSLSKKIKTIERREGYKKKEKVEKVAQEIADIYMSMKKPGEKRRFKFGRSKKENC